MFSYSRENSGRRRALGERPQSSLESNRSASEAVAHAFDALSLQHGSLPRSAGGV